MIGRTRAVSFEKRAKTKDIRENMVASRSLLGPHVKVKRKKAEECESELWYCGNPCDHFCVNGMRSK
jgi:hypothetical protein